MLFWLVNFSELPETAKEELVSKGKIKQDIKYIIVLNTFKALIMFKEHWGTRDPNKSIREFKSLLKIILLKRVIVSGTKFLLLTVTAFSTCQIIVLPYWRWKIFS